MAHSLIFFDRLILLRFTIFGLHFYDFRHSVKSCHTPSKISLIVNPLKGIDDGLPLVKVYLLNHTGSFLHLKELQIVDNIFDVESLLFFEQYNQRNILKLPFGIQNIDEELFFFIQRPLVVDEKYQC